MFEEGLGEMSPVEELRFEEDRDPGKRVQDESPEDQEQTEKTNRRPERHHVYPEASSQGDEH